MGLFGRRLGLLWAMKLALTAHLKIACSLLSYSGLSGFPWPAPDVFGVTKLF
jgi:hypothetical protein